MLTARFAAFPQQIPRQDYYRSLPASWPTSSCRWIKLVQVRRTGPTMGGLRGLRIGMLEGNTDEGYIEAGHGIGNIRSIKSVAEVVNELAIC